MNESPLEQVNSHLRGIAAQVAESPGDLALIRSLIDRYSLVDGWPPEPVPPFRSTTVAGRPCEWLGLADGSPRSRLMYVHGGSWMSGTLKGYRAHAARIAAVTGCCVLNVDYRLMPEHPFPAGLDDIDAALDWLFENGAHGTQAADSVFMAGDSAGGNLVLALLLKRRDQGKPLPNAVVSISPATDLTWQSASLQSRADVDPILRPQRLDKVVNAYLQGHASADDPYVSPLFGDLADLPPIFLQLGDAEILLDDSVRFHDKVTRAGGRSSLDIVADMPHVYQMFAPKLAAANSALQRIGTFVAGNRAAAQ